MKCSRPRCHRVGFHQGLCNPHRDALSAHGVVGQTPSDAALAHMVKLADLSWSDTGIEKTSGIARATLRAIRSGRPIIRATERAILAVPLVPYLSPRSTLPAAGMRRRHQALGWMGWTMEMSAAHSGHSIGSFCAMLKRGTVSRGFWLDYCATFEELRDQAGPNDRIRNLARRWGWSPPIAWEYTDIDDPKAKPFQGFREAA